MKPKSMIKDKQQFQQTASHFFNILFGESLKNNCGEISIEVPNERKSMDQTYHNNVPSAVNAAYQLCQQMADSHYENFPVASKLLPNVLRAPVSAIYAFARTADDYADEGDLDTVTRLAKLDECDEKIRAISTNQVVDDPVYIALADSIKKYSLSTSLFHDLISAFRQDVTKKRYSSFSEVLDYCRRSANPVGRLLLQLLNKASEKNCVYSDSICSALQLINFYQDIVQDYTENDRIYLPEDELTAAGISEADIAGQKNSDSMFNFMQQQYVRTGDMLCSGMPLSRNLGLRMNLEIRATINGGLRVLEHLQTSNNVFSRPRLKKVDVLMILFRCFFPGKACQRFTTSIK